MNKLFLLAVLAVSASAVQAAQNSTVNNIALANKHFEKAQYYAAVNVPAAMAVLGIWAVGKLPFCGRFKALHAVDTAANVAFAASFLGFHYNKAATKQHMEQAGLKV